MRAQARVCECVMLLSIVFVRINEFFRDLLFQEMKNLAVIVVITKWDEVKIAGVEKCEKKESEKRKLKNQF